MAKTAKTNVMRILDRAGIEYNILFYETGDGRNDGISVAQKIGRASSAVFKTLVAQGGSRELYVFIVPVSCELDLKKAARAAGEKKIEMIPVRQLLHATGYVKGGCSPLGMKKQYRTFLDSSAARHEKIIVSGGKVGLQIELPVISMQNAAKAERAELC